MHAFALQRRLKETGITVSVLHPGLVSQSLCVIYNIIDQVNTELIANGFNDTRSRSVAWSIGRTILRRK